MAYVTEEKHVKFVAYKIKGGAAAPTTNHKKAPRQATHDDLEMHETTPTR